MKRFWIIVLTFVVTSLAVGGGTYYFAKAKATKDKDELQAQLDGLNTKVADTNLAIVSAGGTVSESATSGASTSTGATATASGSTAEVNIYDSTKTGSLIYKNDKFNFELTFTSKWKDYKVVDGAGNINAEAAYEVYVPTTIKDYPSEMPGYAKPFVLSIYKKATYDTAKTNSADADSNEPPFDLVYGSKITDNGTYVVTYSSWQDSPEDLRTSGLADEVATVTKSVKFTK